MRKTMIVRLCVSTVIAVSLILMIVGVGTSSAEPGDDSPAICAGIGYQDDLCQCATGDDHEACPCQDCTSDEDCACIVSVKEAGGTITGTIELWRAKAKTKGPKSFKDVIVYLEEVGDNDFPAPVKPARLDQKGLVFIPHVLAVLKGTPIKFLNSDNDKHNVYFLYDDEEGKTETEDLGTWAPGEERTHTFEETREITTLCKLHLEMAAYVIVLDNPFFTIATIDGETQEASFTLQNVPAGTYSLTIWHKKLALKTGPVEVTVVAGETTSEIALTLTKPKYVVEED